MTTLEPKCETDGLKQYRCGLCGEFVKSEVITKLNHSFTKYEKTADATCTENAKETATCDREGCGKTNTRDIENTKLGHNFLDENYKYNNDAKCGIDGTETAKCTRCDATDTRTAVGTALEHNFINYKETTPATCLKNAEETATCENGCGTTHTREVPGSALGHTAKDFNHNEGTETCCELGTKTGVCERCGVTFTVAEDRPEYYASHTYETDASFISLLKAAKPAPRTALKEHTASIILLTLTERTGTAEPVLKEPQREQDIPTLSPTL